MDLNNNNDLAVQIAIEEEAVCMAKENGHDNDVKYHQAVLNSLKELQSIRTFVEPLRSFDTHNLYLEQLKEVVGR